MEEKMISREQLEMLFKATESEFRLSQDYAKTYPEEADNVFRANFAGMRKAIDILGLGSDYIAYVASKEEK